MNLHSIVVNSIAQINPLLNATLQVSTGYATNADGSRVPSYASPVNILIQAQALQYNDLMQIASLNIQGVRKAIYIQGDWEGVVRADNKGGDLITFPDGTIWLVAFVFENWFITSGWTKVCATLQNGS